MSRDPLKIRARELMSKDVVTVYPHDKIHEALQLIVENRVYALPVVDRRDRCIGVLSCSDLIELTREFDEELTAVFSLESDLARAITEQGRCVLEFDQGNQIYHLECGVRAYVEEDEKYQATYWHNHLFNPTMPGVVSVLGFKPDWQNSWFATADGNPS